MREAVTLKMSPFGGNAEQEKRLDAAMKEIEKISTHVDGPFSMIDYGKDGIVALEIKKGYEGKIRLSFISVPEEFRGKGLATRALRTITDIADKHGVAISLDVSPQGKGGLTKAQLFKWYKNHGFRRLPYVMQQDKLSDMMEREPERSASMRESTIASRIADKIRFSLIAGRVVASLAPAEVKALGKITDAYNKKHAKKGTAAKPEIQCYGLYDGSGVSVSIQYGTDIKIADGMRKIGLDPDKLGSFPWISESKVKELGVKLFNAEAIMKDVVKELSGMTDGFDFSLKSVKEAELTSGEAYPGEFESETLWVYASGHINAVPNKSLKTEKIPDPKMEAGKRYTVNVHARTQPSFVEVKRISFDHLRDGWEYDVIPLNEYGDVMSSSGYTTRMEDRYVVSVEPFVPKKHDYTPRNVKVKITSDVVDEWVSFDVEMTGEWEVDTTEATKDRLLDILFQHPTFKNAVAQAKGKTRSAPRYDGDENEVDKPIPIPTRKDDFDGWDIENNWASFSMSTR